MNRRIRNGSVGVVSAAAWVTLAVDAVFDDATIDFSDGQSMLAGCAAVASTLTLAGWARARPATEIYEMGEAAGYRQGKIDATVSRSGASVTPIRRRSIG